MSLSFVMKHQEQIGAFLVPLEWVGADMIMLIYLFATLALGYLTARMMSGGSASQAHSKKKQLEAAATFAEQHANEPMEREEESPSTTSVPQLLPGAATLKKKKNKKRRQANAKEQKRAQEAESMTSDAQMEVSEEASSTMAEASVEGTWRTVETKAKKQPAKQQDPEPCSLEVEGESEQSDSKMDCSDQNNPSISPLMDLSSCASGKDTDSTPSTQSQHDTDSLPEIDLDSQSSSDGEVQGETQGEQELADASGVCDVSTTEPTPRSVENATITQCILPAGPQTDSEFGKESQPDFQVEAWVPVAIPLEYVTVSSDGETILSACFFNGFWQNNQNERVMIEGVELRFESGPVWLMKEQNFHGFTVELNGVEYMAEIVAGGQQIIWSDGDIWTCIGRFQHERSPLWISDPSQLECIMCASDTSVTAPSEKVSVDDVAASAGEAANGLDDESNWDVCWEWSKSQWCRKGAACKWKHPARDICCGQAGA